MDINGLYEKLCKTQTSWIIESNEHCACLIEILNTFNNDNTNIQKFESDCKQDVEFSLFILINDSLATINTTIEDINIRNKLLHQAALTLRILARGGNHNISTSTASLTTIGILAGLIQSEFDFCKESKQILLKNELVVNIWSEGVKCWINLIYNHKGTPEISGMLEIIKSRNVLENLLQRFEILLTEKCINFELFKYDIKLIFLITALDFTQLQIMIEKTNGFKLVCEFIHLLTHYITSDNDPLPTTENMILTSPLKYIQSKVTNVSADDNTNSLEESIPISENDLPDLLCLSKKHSDNIICLLSDAIKILFTLTAKCDESFFDNCDKNVFKALSNNVRLLMITYGTSDLELHQKLFGDCSHLLMNLPFNLIPTLLPKLPSNVLSKYSKQLTFPNEFYASSSTLQASHDHLGATNQISINNLHLLIVSFENRNIALIKLLTDALENILTQNKDNKSSITLTSVTLLPVLSALAKGNSIIRHYLKKRILPPLKQVTTRPEQSEDFRGKIVRLMVHHDFNLAHSTADFLFVLCKENVDRLVKYTGYGNAAGMLLNRGLLTGGRHQGEAEYSSDSDDSDTDEYKSCCENLNPITGAPMKNEPSSLDSMNEEEKEKESAKLIDLIEKLDRGGIIKMIDPSGNPINDPTSVISKKKS